MQRRRAGSGRRAQTVWLAVLAVFVAALAPALSHALRSGAVDGWAEICSTEGARWIKVDPASKAPQPTAPAGHALEHCAYCSIHAATLGLPPALASWAAPIDPTRLAAALELPPTRGLGAWQRPQARGPPRPTLIA